MTPVLYYMDVSPPARSVLLTAKALGCNLELKSINLLAGEHKNSEFLKLNPQGTVPTLEDGGYVLWDSHAILTYLADKYGTSESLYPKDIQKRGVVTQRLHFNGGFLQPRMRLILRRLFLGEINEVPEDKAKDVIEAYGILECFLKDETSFMAGTDLTVADFSLVSSVSSLDPIVPIPSNFAKLRSWLIRMQALPYYQEANQVHLDKYIQAIKQNLNTVACN